MRRVDLTRSAFWRGLQNALTGGIRQRITRLGLVYSAAVTLTGVAAFLTANNLLFLLLSAQLATLLLSGFVSRLGLAGLELEFHLPDHLTARVPTACRLRLHNTKRWMPSFSIHLGGAETIGMNTVLYFPVIPGGATLEEAVAVEFPRRGSYRENSFHFSTRFPFGFTARRVQVTLSGEAIVYPSIAPQDGFPELLARVEGELDARSRGRSSDFYRIRPYEPLESARHVDWKASAHTGALQVREFEREEDPCVEITLDLARAGGDWFEAWFERAVEACAFLAWRVASRGGRVRFRTQAVDLRVPEEHDVYAILRYLALVAPQAGSAPDPSHDPSMVQVYFTARPESRPEVRVVSPADLATGAGAAAHLH